MPRDTDSAVRGRIRSEVLLVLGLSLGASAIYSIVAIANRLTAATALSKQTATLNASLSPRPVFDLVYQLLAIVFDLVPAALVVFLLWRTARPHLARLGVDLRQPWRDAIRGLALAAVIGVPGLALYLAGRTMGITVHVVPNALDAFWWTVPVLVLSAARSAVLEEVVAIGYLFARLSELGWGRWQLILASALLRGTYHLYQGFGAFAGNIAMGILFGWLYTRYGRILPLVIAHFVIDALTFVGYPWAAAVFPSLFG